MGTSQNTNLYLFSSLAILQASYITNIVTHPRMFVTVSTEPSPRLVVQMDTLSMQQPDNIYTTGPLNTKVNQLPAQA